ncbi:unnamed protein product [Notodromas monacha]|uniref:Ribosomal RNA-processing protein 7 C-terminal domain-containing protein n=1 Tax=Notodromas monacha TaxID=399045 RepID=A0A7R9GA11_9CRUS|nr:unnamed protein product [Notodromas monacha]CAG0913638.1 unnamed protein product [Notodromas monacha]
MVSVMGKALNKLKRKIRSKGEKLCEKSDNVIREGLDDIPFEADGFRVVPWKFNEDAEHFCLLGIKEHKVRKSCLEKPLGRTLLVTEVPPSFTIDVIKHIFSNFGDILEVIFQAKPTVHAATMSISTNYPSFDDQSLRGYKVAYVVFSEAEAVSKALSHVFNTPFLVSSVDNFANGLQSFVMKYNAELVDEESLLLEAKQFLKGYDEEENLRKEQEKSMGEPDEDGWVTVGSRGSKRGGFSRSEALTMKIGEAEKKKRAKKELVNFYTFQIRESKMKNIEEIQKRFEQDKRRIEMMKQSRRFRPY